MTKTCSKCDTDKPLAKFYKNKRSADGHRPNCKKCHNKVSLRYQKTDKALKYYRSQDRRAYFAEYTRNKRATNPNYRIAVTLRTRLRYALNGTLKADTTEALLGCTYEEACAHIEAQFTEGMSWDKMGLHGIHIDHIRPCASFDLTDPEQQRECFHYTNLQPLWAEDNLRKSDRW